MVIYVISFSSSQAVCLPICLLRLFTGRRTGKAESRPPQTAQRCCCFFIAWWTGLIGGHSGKAGRLIWVWSDLGFSFDFLRLLIFEWVGWNPSADVKSREETTRHGYRLSYLLRHAQLTNSCIICHGYHSKLFACILVCLFTLILLTVECLGCSCLPIFSSFFNST